MGLLDDAKKLAEDNKKKIADGVDKVTDMIDDKTGGKHTDNLEKADEAAADWADDAK